ncbi:MAG: NSS family neurotransmitter:Na+ symporter [Halioglobus sp.]
MTLLARKGFGGWQSRTTFVLALSASSVGLGNIWRFSYLTGEYGGAPFVISYLFCLFFIAVPLLIAEVAIGTHGRGSPTISLRWSADRSLLSRNWMIIGVLACITGLLILSYYAVIAGWALAYTGVMASGTFAAASALTVGEYFDQFLSSPRVLIYWQSLFLLMTVVTVSMGVRRGIGLLVWVAVPALIALLAVLVIFGVENGDIKAAQQFLFSVKMIDFTPQSVLVALGHAFFTLGVGVGAGIVYGAYAPERIPVGRSVVAVALFDTLISLAVGLAIFPIVFANNIEPSMGPGLLFVSVPYAFGNILQGELFGTLFFAVVVIAALGSAVAMMEPIVRMVMQHRRWPRLLAVLVVAGIVWVLGLGTVLSFNVWQNDLWFANWNFFELLDAITAGLLLPLVSLLTAVFVGWYMRPEILRMELFRESDLFFALWRFLLRYFVPLAIIVVFVCVAFGLYF